jgi:DNA-binding beta-propeller fold protein YncE
MSVSRCHIVALASAIALCAGAAQATSAELTQRRGSEGCVSRTEPHVCGYARGLRGARSVVVSPDGRNVYALAAASDTLVVFDRNRSTGALRQKLGLAGCVAQAGTGDGCTDATAFDSLRWMAISPDGGSVYVGSRPNLADAVAVFDRDPRDGTLAQKPGAAGCVVAGFVAVGCAVTRPLDSSMGQVSPDGTSVYMVRSFGLVTFERAPDGVLGRRLGTGCPIAEEPFPQRACASEFQGSPDWVTISPDGRSAYMVSSYDGVVVTFDRDARTGVLTRRPGRTGCIAARRKACLAGRGMAGPRSAVVSPDGRNVYVASDGGNAIAVLDRDRRTGLLSQRRGRRGCLSETGDGGACTDATALEGARTVAISPDGASVYVTSAGSHALAIFSRDRPTGALTQPRGRAGCLMPAGAGGACSTARAFARASSAAVSPDGRNVYVAAADSDAVVVLNRRR